MFKIVRKDSVVIPRNLDGNIINLVPSICLSMSYDTNIDDADKKYREALIAFVKTWFHRDISDALP